LLSFETLGEQRFGRDRLVRILVILGIERPEVVAGHTLDEIYSNFFTH
jgi:hypothetical protein